MPGLVAIFAEPGQIALNDRLDKMLRALDWPGAATSRLVLPELGVALGQISPARAATPQPGYTADGQIAALVEGEPIAGSGAAERLGLAATTPPAALLAARYERDGAAGLESLSGHWAVALVDRRERRVILANDAFGLRPLYRMGADIGVWLIGSHPAALLAYPAAARALNPAGMADFLVVGHPMGAKTLFRGVERLPGATLLTWAGGEMSLRRYWAPEFRPTKRWSERDLQALRDTFNQTIADMSAAGAPASVALSGGADSRAILSALLVAGLRPHTMIHSVSGATDADLSAQVAERAGTPHHFYEIRGEDLAAQVQCGVRLLGGQAAGIDVHPLCCLSDFAGFGRAIFTGLGGNLIKGNDFFLEAYRCLGRQPALNHWTLARYEQVLHVATDFPALFRPDWYAELRDQPLRSITEVLEALGPGLSPESRSHLFYLQERVCKYLTKGDAVVRPEIETRHPFMTREFLQQAWHLPEFARFQNLIESYIITKNAPELLDVPTTSYQGDGFPLRRFPSTRLEEAKTLWSQLGHFIRQETGRGAKMVSNYRYADWIRGPLRTLFTDVLLDPRALARPYFRPETIRRWLDEHLAGQNRTPQLAALLSLELTIRELLEAPAA